MEPPWHPGGARTRSSGEAVLRSVIFGFLLVLLALSGLAIQEDWQRGGDILEQGSASARGELRNDDVMADFTSFQSLHGRPNHQLSSVLQQGRAGGRARLQGLATRRVDEEAASAVSALAKQYQDAAGHVKDATLSNDAMHAVSKLRMELSALEGGNTNIFPPPSPSSEAGMSDAQLRRVLETFIANHSHYGSSGSTTNNASQAEHDKYAEFMRKQISAEKGLNAALPHLNDTAAQAVAAQVFDVIVQHAASGASSPAAQHAGAAASIRAHAHLLKSRIALALAHSSSGNSSDSAQSAATRAWEASQPSNSTTADTTASAPNAPASSSSSSTAAHVEVKGGAGAKVTVRSFGADPAKHVSVQTEQHSVKAGKSQDDGSPHVKVIATPSGTSTKNRRAVRGEDAAAADYDGGRGVWGDADASDAVWGASFWDWMSRTFGIWRPSGIGSGFGWFGVWLLIVLAFVLTVMGCMVVWFGCFGCCWMHREWRRQDRLDKLFEGNVPLQDATESGKDHNNNKPEKGGKTSTDDKSTPRTAYPPVGAQRGQAGKGPPSKGMERHGDDDRQSSHSGSSDQGRGGGGS